MPRYGAPVYNVKNPFLLQIERGLKNFRVLWRPVAADHFWSSSLTSGRNSEDRILQLSVDSHRAISIPGLQISVPF